MKGVHTFFAEIWYVKELGVESLGAASLYEIRSTPCA